MNILSYSSFEKTLFELKTYLEEVHRYCDFYAQSQEQSNSNNIAFSCQKVKKYSQDASIICLQLEKVSRSSITVYFFNCKIDEMKAYTHNVYKDVTYKNALVIPLYMLVTKNDKHNINIMSTILKKLMFLSIV